MVTAGRSGGPARRRRRRLLLLLALALAGALIMFTTLQRTFIFPRWHTRPDPRAGQGVPGLQRLWLDIPEGKVEAWYLPGEKVSASRPGPLLVYLHGNAELIEEWPQALQRYRRLGINILLPEYRGYGRSAGRPSQKGILEDVGRFLDQTLQRPEVDRSRLILQGRSLGGGVACALALGRRPAALILQSTFTSLRAMARRYLVPGFLVRDPFDNLAALPQLTVPILIVHGTRDELIPYQHAETLQAAAPRARLVSFPVGHNDPLSDEPRFWEEVERFLEEAGLLGEPPP